MEALWPLLIQAPLLVGSGFLAVWFGIGCARMARGRRTLVNTRDGVRFASESRPRGSVCVVVPAHNEAACIGRMVSSLAAQNGDDVSFVVALDRCDDGSEAIAREAAGDDPRFDFVVIDDCPADWAGKIHAICRAVETSDAARSADVLVFTDADTTWDPMLLTAAHALLEHESVEMLSLWSTLTGTAWYEQIVQPAAGLELLYQHPLYRVNREDDPAAFANGQFIMFRRNAYERIGGHAAVNEDVFEDLALARLAVKHGVKVGAYDACGMLRVRMYDSWSAFRNGWKRIFLDSANRRIKRLEKYWRRIRRTNVWLPLGACLGIVLACVTPLEPVWARWSIIAFHSAALVINAALVAWVYRLASFPIWATLLAPIGNFLLAGIVKEAATDLREGRPIVWGGKTYYPKPR